MTSVGILFLIVIFFLLVSLKNAKGDLASPSVILCVGFTLSIFFALFNERKWGTVLITDTYILIITAIISFMFGERVLKLKYRTQTKYWHNNSNRYFRAKFKVSVFKYIFVLLIGLLSIALLLKEVGFTSVTKLSETAADYRENNDNTSALVVNLSKFTRGFAYIFLYIFIHNAIGYKRKYNFINLIPILLFFTLSILRAGRLSILVLLIAGFFIWYLEIQKRKNWTFKFNLKKIILITLSVVFVLQLFFFVRTFVGRTSDTSTNSTFFEYLASYIGGSIELCNQYVSSYGLEKKFPIWSAFPSLASSFNKLGIISIPESAYSLDDGGFAFSKYGDIIGNVYTGTVSILMGTGLTGVILFYFVMSIIFNYVYIKLKRISFSSSSRLALLLIYSYSLYTILFQGIVEFFYYSISIGWFVEMAVQFFCIHFIIGKQLKKINI
jgi:oligosaccharide repeat unit polymerase